MLYGNKNFAQLQQQRSHSQAGEQNNLPKCILKTFFRLVIREHNLLFRKTDHKTAMLFKVNM